MIRGRWCRRLLAAGATVLLLAACSGGNGEEAGDATATTAAGVVLDPAAVDAFLAELREGEGGAALANRGDDELVADGQVLCDALAETGSALDAANALQAASGSYDGQTRVIEVARRTLCPAEDGG